MWGFRKLAEWNDLLEMNDLSQDILTAISDYISRILKDEYPLPMVLSCLRDKGTVQNTIDRFIGNTFYMDRQFILPPKQLIKAYLESKDHLLSPNVGSLSMSSIRIIDNLIDIYRGLTDKCCDSVNIQDVEDNIFCRLVLEKTAYLSLYGKKYKEYIHDVVKIVFPMLCEINATRLMLIEKSNER